METPEIREDTIWHELQNAYRTRKILTGTLGGIEKMEGGGTIAVVYYKEMRVVIPLAEMMINLVEDVAHDYGELVQRQNKILGIVRILSVKLHSLEDISVKADVKSVNGNTSKENLSKCKIQGKYAGTVTDIHKGTIFVRLHIGVNAVAHSCYDNRLPGKKDEVSFVVTRIDSDRNVAVGLISRIIKQNI